MTNQALKFDWSFFQRSFANAQDDILILIKLSFLTS